LGDGSARGCNIGVGPSQNPDQTRFCSSSPRMAPMLNHGDPRVHPFDLLLQHLLVVPRGVLPGGSFAAQTGNAEVKLNKARPHARGAIGWIANLLELFPDNPFTTGPAFVAEGLVWLARHLAVDLPGLSAMNGDGPTIGQPMERDRRLWSYVTTAATGWRG
jgi:hypothetical protein